MVRLHLKPRMIFLRCTDFLAEKRIQIPDERRLADPIRTHLNVCKNDLISLADMHLPPDLRARLDSRIAERIGIG